MAHRAAETGAAVPSRHRTASESPAKAAEPGREEDSKEEPRRAGGREGSESKRRGHGARAKSAGRREEDESGDGACGSTAEKRGEPRDGSSRGRGRRPELRVVLLGRSGAGRSATGNTLLGEERFESRLASQPVTTTCKEGRRDWGEWSVVVMDTPAIFGGSQLDEQRLAEERQRCLRFAARQPCVLLLVTQLGRYTREDREVQESVQKLFGKGAKQRMMVVFTRKEDLGGGSLDEYVKVADRGALRELVKACGKQCCAVSNRAPRRDRDVQADEVLHRAVSIALRQSEGRGESSCWLCLP
ncbi:GTPase IMAP family member 1-like [Tympanuchus pallidicinctus]|uniref:GTPase IMAP family member 1-like n=1 Tax=Tympanuchus pallidicinctus TaxID=109042 RepID=UPI0022872B27|nr:GTPase IMAP family member 1-like [Tympanuchus pallidicinctus]